MIQFENKIRLTLGM